MILAISNTKFGEIAYSALYPNDEIRYDFFNILCEDNATARKGKITRRLDRIKNNGAEYDFRNIKFRRWRADAPVWSSTTTYAKWANVKIPDLDGNGEQIKDIIPILDSAGNQIGTKERLRWSFYVAWKANTNVSVHDTTEATGAWVFVLNQYQTQFVAFNKTSFYLSESLFTVDTTDYVDLYTFNSDLVDVKNLGKFAVNEANNVANTNLRNNIIGKSGATSGDAVFYNNIIISNCKHYTATQGVYNNNFGGLYDSYFNWYTYGNNFNGFNMYGNIFLDQTFDNIIHKQYVRNYFAARCAWVTFLDEVYTFLCSGRLVDSIFTNDTTSNIMMSAHNVDLRCFDRFGGNITHRESSFTENTFIKGVHNTQFVRSYNLTGMVEMRGKRVADLNFTTFIAKVAGYADNVNIKYQRINSTGDLVIGDL